MTAPVAFAIWWSHLSADGGTIIHLVQSVAVDLLRISGLDGADVQSRLADALAAAPPETRLRI
jgi:hypothetical protein